MLRTVLLVTLAVALPGAAQAHPPLPHVNWCATGTIVEIAPFSYNENQLTDALPEASSGCQGTCGDPDDDYRRTMNFTQRFCGGYQVQTLFDTGDIGDVIALIEGPPTFLHSTHHQRYFIGHGIYGACVRCDAVTAVPLPPRPPAPFR